MEQDFEFEEVVAPNEVAVKKPHAKDPKLDLLIAQLIIALIALVVMLAIKLIGGNIFTYSKSVFVENFDKPINISQVLNANDANKIVAAQARYYGVGGESEDLSIPYFESYDDITDDISEKISLTEINKMQIPASGKITSEFGFRTHPISGKRSMHTGIDIGADSGDKIVSALNGKVKKVVKNDADYGNYIILTHANGVETMYAHCSKITAKEGQNIKKGEAIALAGSTGLSTGPHLHFEVRVNSIRLNPRWFVNF